MYKKIKLENNLRIVTKEMKDRESVAVGLFVTVGGRHENDQNKGAAHFLEHILFKGSKNYSCGAIKEQIEGVGGSLNAFTSEEDTCYYAKVPTKHLNRTFDILSDMVIAPLVAAKDVEKERSVILEEIKMYRDLPQYLVSEILDELLWPNHPLGKNLAGTVDSVKGLNNLSLRKFHQQYYRPCNLIVSACGNLDSKAFTDLVEKKFAGLNGNNRCDFEPVTEKQTAARVGFCHKPIEQMHLALGLPGIKNDHKDKYALSLLNIVLGGNMSSRLFDELREKRGLAYSVASCAKYYKDAGVFYVSAGVDHRKIVDVIKLINKEFGKIKKRGITKDEFVRAKDFLLGQILLGLEDTLDHMLWVGESIVCRDRIRTLDEIITNVKKVKREDLQRVAQDIFDENHLNMAFVGPIKDKQKKEIRSLLNI